MFDLKNYDGNKIICSCKREHIPVVKNIVNKKGSAFNILSVLKNYYAAGHIAFVTSSDIPKDITEKIKNNLKKNYKITSVVYPENALVNKENAQKILQCPEEVRFVIGVGSGSLIDIIKLALHFRKNTNYIFCPTAPSTSAYALSHFNYIESGILKTEKSPEMKCLVLDEDIYSCAPKKLIASGCGEIFSRYLTLFDNYFESRLAKTPLCGFLTDGIRYDLDCFLNDCKKCGHVSSKSVMETLMDISLKESVLSEETALKGGEILATLISLKARGRLAGGTDNFISAVSILSFYKLYFKNNFPDITLPSDKLNSLNILRKNCNLNYVYYLNRFLLDKNSDYLKDAYIIKEYRNDLKEILDNMPSLDLLCSIFRRFFSDCGYFLNSYIGQKDIYSLMSASYPLIKGTPLIKHLTAGGFTEASLGMCSI